jgi:hypothetical protein
MALHGCVSAHISPSWLALVRRDSFCSHTAESSSGVHVKRQNKIELNFSGDIFKFCMRYSSMKIRYAQNSFVPSKVLYIGSRPTSNLVEITIMATSQRTPILIHKFKFESMMKRHVAYLIIIVVVLNMFW